MHDLTPLRVLDVVKSQRKGSTARVVDEDGQTFDAWLWWYQASADELLVCRLMTGADPARCVDGIVHVGTEDERGVIDRVPRDIMRHYFWFLQGNET